jgi:hypothetical protein
MHGRLQGAKGHAVKKQWADDHCAGLFSYPRALRQGIAVSI